MEKVCCRQSEPTKEQRASGSELGKNEKGVTEVSVSLEAGDEVVYAGVGAGCVKTTDEYTHGCLVLGSHRQGQQQAMSTGRSFHHWLCILGLRRGESLLKSLVIGLRTGVRR